MSTHVPDVRIDDLLAHAGWVRGLALSLVKDPGTADDLVQETWLAAMRKPPAGDRPVRGWLAGVVRNLARQRRRGEGRRARRESAVGTQREPLPSTGELAERMETQRDLAEAIRGLEEPWRSTVILRFLEGLSSAEIARRQGVPGATVRGRLKRGLAALRETLDERHGGDRRAWHVALLPFLPRPFAPAPTGTTAGVWSALVSGVLTMSVTAKILWSSVLLVFVFGALGVTGVLPLFDDEPEEAPRHDTASLAGEEDATLRGPSLDATGRAPRVGRSADAEAEPAPVSDLVPRTGRIEARIVDADGKGIGGAVLYGAVESGMRVTSDAKGHIALVVAEGACRGPLSLIAHGAGHVLRELSVRAQIGETTRLGDVWLAPGGALRGRVLGPDGRLVMGAHVQATMPDLSPYARKRGPVDGPMSSPLPVAVKATDGTFGLPGLPVGFVRLWASHPGMRYAFSEPIEIRAGQVREDLEMHLLPLEAEDAIRGRVTYPDGKPAVHAAVHYEIRHERGSHSGRTHTDVDGRFELRMGGGGTATLRFAADGGWSAPSRHGVVPSHDPVRVELGKSPTVRVQVRTADGVRVPVLSVYAVSGNGARLLTWYTGEFPGDGVVELAAPSEPYRLDVKASGYRTVQLGPLDAGSAPDGLEAVLERLPTLQGVVRANGQPVAGARLRLHRPTKPTSHVRLNGFDVRVDPAPVAEARTDKEGRYALGLEKGGRYILRAEAKGYAPSEQSKLQVDGERGKSGLDFALTVGGVLEGTVRLASDRSAVGLIVGISRGDGYARTQRTKADGTYRFEHLMPGDYEARIVESEIHPSSSNTAETQGVEPPPIRWSCHIDADRTTTYDIDERADAARQVVLAGSIRVDDAAPRGWTYELMTEPAVHGLPTTLKRGTVDAEGHFEVTADNPGRYRLMVTSEGQRQGLRAFYTAVDLQSGRNAWSASVRTGTLEGVVESGRPPADVRIFLVWLGPDGAIGLTQLAPAEDGTFRVEGVFAGKANVVRLSRTEMASMKPVDAMNPERWPAVARVDIEAGTVTSVKIP